MQKRRFAHDPRSERRQLLVLGMGLGAFAIAQLQLTQSRVAPAVFCSIAALALVGAAAYRWIGRDVFLIFAIAAQVIGSVVSVVAVLLIYIVGIASIGGILRLLGMDRMQRHFGSCRRRDSMFYDAPATDMQSFRRQS